MKRSEWLEIDSFDAQLRSAHAELVGKKTLDHQKSLEASAEGHRQRLAASRLRYAQACEDVEARRTRGEIVADPMLEQIEPAHVALEPLPPAPVALPMPSSFEAESE